MKLEFPTHPPFDYAAFEPNLDAKTMEIHYSKHHKGYFDALMKEVQLDPRLKGLSAEEILHDVSSYNERVKNNCGGFYNHTIFWESLRPETTKPDGVLLKMINHTWGSFESFKSEFSKAAMEHFGSGWLWLIQDPIKRLVIVSSDNQDNPQMNTCETPGTPLLNLDLWEHAYYLHYQNKKNDYIHNWWNIVNWKNVSKNLIE